jgi:hypothetical protein
MQEFPAGSKGQDRKWEVFAISAVKTGEETHATMIL